MNYEKKPVVNVGVYCCVRQNMTVLRHKFQCKRCSFIDVYDTKSYDHNPAHTRRMTCSPYMVVILSITTVFVNVNDTMGSFMIVIKINMGLIIQSIQIFFLLNIIHIKNYIDQ